MVRRRVIILFRNVENQPTGKDTVVLPGCLRRGTDLLLGIVNYCRMLLRHQEDGGVLVY